MIQNLMKNFLRYIGIVVVVLFLLAFLPVFLIYRKYSQYKTFEKQKKRLHHGIHVLEAITIGGIKQWISVRGENKENPLLLILPGGPGASMMPYAAIFRTLEADFTIVQWDQRGVGKTFGTNKKIVAFDTITIKQMQADTLEMVKYLCKRFKKAKLYVLGHSWGSFLGLTLAHDYPELLHAYIGVGQFINIQTNEKTGLAYALKTAYAKNNKKAIKALESLTTFHESKITMKELLILRKWQFKLDALLIKKHTLFLIMLNALTVPEYSIKDYFSLLRGISLLSKSTNLFNEIINIALDDNTNFATPIFIFAGQKDIITPSAPVYEYFKKIDSPHKEYVWFENSGHNLFFEETDKFVERLCALKNLY